MISSSTRRSARIAASDKATSDWSRCHIGVSWTRQWPAARDEMMPGMPGMPGMRGANRCCNTEMPVTVVAPAQSGEGTLNFVRGPLSLSLFFPVLDRHRADRKFRGTSSVNFFLDRDTDYGYLSAGRCEKRGSGRSEERWERREEGSRL